MESNMSSLPCSGLATPVEVASWYDRSKGPSRVFISGSDRNLE